MKKYSKTEIYEKLLSDIVLLKIKPGEYIKETEISEKFNISRTPMREIIKRLALEGYVEVIPRHGNKVSLININSVKQMMSMRIVLETHVQKYLALNIKHNQKAILKDILQQQKYAIDTADNDAFWELDNKFHQTMFEYAGKGLWWDIIRRYEAHYMRFRKLEMTDNTNYELLFIHHKNIIKNIEERHMEEIEPLLDSHIGFCIEKMPLLMDKYPQYFNE